jgi:hypothetical protein
VGRGTGSVTTAATIWRARRSPRTIAAILILIAQFAIAGWYHLGERRYFAWAPNDYIVTYDLEVTVGGRTLTEQEISDRYRIRFGAWDPLTNELKARLGLSPRARYIWEDPAQHLIDRIQSYEEVNGAGNPARVRLIYQVAGGPEREWLWP